MQDANQELKSQFSKKRDGKSPGHKRVEELDMKKGDVAVSMLKRAVKNGFLDSYILMDRLQIDGQIADVTITLATHTILSLQKRFSSYETMGELFRETQQHLLELTLWECLVKMFNMPDYMPFKMWETLVS